MEIIKYFSVILVKLVKTSLNRTIYILLSYFLLSATALKAQYNNIEFIENKGQWDSRIKFSGQVAAGLFYVEQNGFMVVQHNPEDWAKVGELTHSHEAKNFELIKEGHVTIRSHAYNVEFLNGNPNSELIPDKPLPGYNNYFLGNDPSKWASDCKVYQGITVKNIYPNVDVRYYSDKSAVKYDLIIKPGADISRIALKYRGADKLELRNKELTIKTSAGDLKELAPYSYQYDERPGANSAAREQKKEVICKYKLKNNVVSFDIKNYDPSSTLIIDPSLVFCSFTGSTADNWGFTATYGPDGSMYGGGIVFSAGFPVSPGAFQTTYAGGDGNGWGAIDIGIIKLSPNGSNRVYATYVGGAGNEMPQSLICDPQGELIIAGRSSSSNYPTKPSGNLSGPGGGFDIIITKLNAAGNGLIGSMRIGGTGQDGANITEYGGGATSLQRNYGDEARSEVILDNAGNIYLASCTRSNDFPKVSAFQAANAGNQDAVVLKISPDVSTLLFSSYLGGSGDDAAYVLSIDPTSGNLYVAGGTASGDFPGNKGGTIGPGSHGGIDGFVAVISGTNLIRSTYLGTSGIDQVYGIQFDKNGFPYVTGQTTGTWPFVAPPGNPSPWNQPGGKQFISKLKSDLSAFVYSITFGTTALPNISPTAFLVDRCENVYVSGWGGCFCQGSPTFWQYPNAGTAGLPVTADAGTVGKSTTDGRDFYFFVLKKDAKSQLFGAFFGEGNINGTDHVDGGTSRFDQNGVIYQAICANCKELDGGAVFPTTPGAWSTTNPSTSGGRCNLALVKIAFNLAGVKAGIVSIINGVPRDSAGCVPLTVDFKDTVKNAVSYEWTFGDGSPQVKTTVPSTSHTFNSVGSYTVMLVAIDSTTCNIRDTSYVHIRVGDVKALIAFDPVKLNPCDSFKYRFDNLSTAPIAFSNNSFTWDFGDGSPRINTGSASVFHSYTAPGTYNVRLILTDTSFCNAPDSVTIQLRVAALVKAQFTTPPAGCVPYNAVFTNTSLAGQTFQWDFGDGGTSTAINPTHLYTVPGTYTVTLIANDPGTCNLTDTTTLTIVVADIPIADFSFAPDPPIENTPTTFTNLSSPDAIRFIWKFGDGDSLGTTSRLEVSHQYNATGTFNACLVAFNVAGCPDTVCKPVSAIVIPAVDVPNAFTPLSGTMNSKIFVKGFGITKMKFIIWNRWGQKVFETNDKSIGWDGRFSGTIQPMDVYAYTLDVEFFDGKKTTKKGDITLIR